MEKDSHPTMQLAMQHLIASADLCELMAAAFSFPSETLASGLAEGSFEADARACLHELGHDTSQLKALPAASFVELRREYSRLFLVPGGEALIFPYEAAFRHVSDGREGTPALFIAPATKDVEHRMLAAGALPANARTEPVDSIAAEFGFLRFLYTSLANALHLDDAGEAHKWRIEIVEFRESHVDVWLPLLMRRVLDETRSPTYAWLAEFALIALELTSPVMSTTRS